MAARPKRTFEEISRCDPHRKADWRHTRVLEMVDRFPTPGRCTWRDDTWIRALRTHILCWNQRNERERIELLLANPGLTQAYTIYEKRTEDAYTPFMIEARLLARQTPDQIAELMQLLPETIEAYEACFFAIADSIDRHDWILRHVLIPAAMRAAVSAKEPDKKDMYATTPIIDIFFDWTIKFYAYYGGPLMLDFMLSGYTRGNAVTSRDEISNYLANQWSLQIQKRAGQAAGKFEVNKFNVMALNDLHARILEIGKAAAMQDNKHTGLEANVNMLLGEIPFSTGDDAQARYQNTPLAPYDGNAAELRDSEACLIAAGEVPDSASEVATMVFPPPRKQDHGGKDAHADPLG